MHEFFALGVFSADGDGGIIHVPNAPIRQNIYIGRFFWYSREFVLFPCRGVCAMALI